MSRDRLRELERSTVELRFLVVLLIAGGIAQCGFTINQPCLIVAFAALGVAAYLRTT